MDALINVVLPVFGIILTGYLAGRFEALGPESAAALNRFVFYFALASWPKETQYFHQHRHLMLQVGRWQHLMGLLCPSTNLKIFQRNLSRQSIPRPTAV